MQVFSGWSLGWALTLIGAAWQQAGEADAIRVRLPPLGAWWKRIAASWALARHASRVALMMDARTTWREPTTCPICGG